MTINDYITIKEAVNLSGKSQSTIQRLCNSLEGTYNIKRDSGKYLISKKYLLEHYKTTNKETDNKTVSHDYSMIIQILKDELEAKNQQLSDLNERLREANIINLNFQKQLKLNEKSPETRTDLYNDKKSFLKTLKALFIIED